MSEGNHEIVIIRRGGHGDHDDHHGGVWKIAFADFMTAMMAFFLVMWLISANDKTRASVARYFNPVKLVDATTQPRGLRDPKKDESGVTASADSKERTATPEKAKDGPSSPPSASGGESSAAREQRLDRALAENPYPALAEIAAAKGPGEVAPMPVRQSPAAVMGRRGGEQFRDPFAPPPPLVEPDDEAIAALTPAKIDAPKPEAPKPEAPKSEDHKPEPVKLARDAKAKAKSEADRQAADAKAQIVAAAQKDGGRDAAGPAIDVKHTAEGLLVSLTDTASYTMFSSGSAVPSRRTVQLMERVAQVLKARPGAVVVRGYTDNKPYRSGRYDNWRLSLDRAQVAHYMLVRGGLADDRFGHVEGHADHDARPGLDPASPMNRRIEILLKDAG